MIWLWEFLGGLVLGWIAISLLLSKGFWMFLVGLIFGRKAGRYEPSEEEEEEEPAPPKPRPQPVKSKESPKDDFSQMSREELAELFRNEEVRWVKK